MEISTKVFEEKPRDLWKYVDSTIYQVEATCVIFKYNIELL
jgi:hypothetical protein